MVDSFFTVFSVRRGGKKKTPQSSATAPHHSEMAAAINQGESAVSYPVSSSSCSLHEAIQACRGLSRHHATVLSDTVCQLAAASTQVIRLLKPTMSQEFQDDFPLLTVIYQGNVFLHTDEFFGVIMTMWHGSQW